MISKGGCDDDVSFETTGEAGVAEEDMVVFLGRLASGEFGRDGGACSVCGAECCGGVDALVITLKIGREIAFAYVSIRVASVVLVNGV